MEYLASVRNAYSRAWHLRWPFLAAHLSIALLTTAIISPLTAALLHLGVRLSGAPALTDQDIAGFLLTPLGLIVLVAIASIALTSAALGVSVMMAIDLADRTDKRAGFGSRVANILASLPTMLNIAVRFILRLLVIAVPFVVAAVGVAALTLTQFDINYYLSERPPEFLIAAGLIGLLLLALVAILANRSAAWCLALPGVLFADTETARAFPESARQMQGRKGRLLRLFALWAIAGLALGAIVLGAVGLIARLALPLAGDVLAHLAALLVGVVALSYTATAIATALTSGSLAVLVIDTAERAGLDLAVPEASAASAHPMRRFLFAGAAVLAIVAGIGSAVALVDDLKTDNRVEVIAHRGAAGVRPENTLAAMQKAIEDGADWVEIDVQETADGEVVVLHDSDFMKLAGVDLKIWDATLDDLATIDIGSWFGPEYGSERTPTLRQVLDVARGRSRVLIELKYYGHDVMLEERVARIVEAAGMVDQIAVMSLKYPAVQKMKALRPEWRVGLLAAVAIGDLTALDADFLAVNEGIATPHLMRQARTAGKDVYVWTVNDPLVMSAMTSLGVQGLITDEPELALETLRARAELNTAERLLLWAGERIGLDATAKSYRDDQP